MIFYRCMVVSFILIVFGYAPLSAERIYETGDLPLCPKHLFWHIKCVKCAETVKKYAYLIPGSNTCKKYICHQCGEIPWEEEFVLDDGDELIFVDGLSCHCKDALYGHLGDDFGGYWADKMSSWSSCERPAIYKGYFEDSRYIPLFAEYLCFFEANPCCTHLWPELSPKAATINSIAYDLFYQLLTTTALKCLVEDRSEQYNFLYNQTRSATTTARLLVSHAFFFSNYEFICRDLENYSNYQFYGKELETIRDQLHLIREALAPLFLGLYKDCPPGCQSHYLNQENEWLRELCTQSSQPSAQSESDLLQFVDLNDTHYGPYLPYREISGIGASKWIDAEILVAKGIGLSDQGLYSEAISLFTEAIQRNPYQQDAFLERALCYFETEQLAQALQDYQKTRELDLAAPYRSDFNYDPPRDSGPLKTPSHSARHTAPANLLEFSQGIVGGILSGSREALEEFIPNVCSSCRGMAHGLWAFACSPVEVSGELLDSAYSLGEFLCEHDMGECLECVVPELRELRTNWHALDDQSRGNQMGYLVGKYGLDILLPGATMKAMKEYNALKKANALLTLERCTLTQAQQALVLQENGKYAAKLVAMKEAQKAGKILVKNANAKHHIMQKKHAWDKLIALSGNVDEDFRKVVALLEEHGIKSKLYLERTLEFPIESPIKKVINNRYVKEIDGYIVEAFFETHIKTGVVFLQDAWVITK